MRSPQEILLSGSFGELQEQRRALAAIVDPIEAKRQASQDLADKYGKELADTQAILTAAGTSDYETPVSELAKRLVERETRLRVFVEEVAEEKGEYGRYGYGQPTMRALEAKGVLAGTPTAPRGDGHGGM